MDFCQGYCATDSGAVGAGAGVVSCAGAGAGAGVGVGVGVGAGAGEGVDGIGALWSSIIEIPLYTLSKQSSFVGVSRRTPRIFMYREKS